MNINLELTRLVQYALRQSLIAEEDVVYSTNRLLSVLGLNAYRSVETDLPVPETAAPILENILDWAAENGVLMHNGPVYRDLLDTELMACLMPRPSEVKQAFYTRYTDSPKLASDYFYHLSQASNYIRMDRIEKNMVWTADTAYGDIIISINLSKPEKDPKAIAAALELPPAEYPKCLLCKETEGYKGNVSQPPRGNHRILPLELCGEPWFLQYSPYVYYNEHCILLNAEHIPMKVNRTSFERILRFVEFMPHYFMGSNADLPIVGGSILTHDHFQGGNFAFPMAEAGISQEISFKGYEGVQAGLVNWPMSVIRLAHPDIDTLCDLGDKILTAWRSYSDASADILAFTGETPHNTITPIARFRDGRYELDLVLRNNRTTQEHPLGLFHPRAEYHHLKKENIGLIEVMGLAILPARLKDELETLKYYLLHPEESGKLTQDASMQKHLPWYRELREQQPAADTVEQLVSDSVGQKFAEILENAGVYKQTEAGREAFLRFIHSINA